MRPARRDIWCVYIAMISLPVPLSPRISTGMSDFDTSCACASTSRIRLLNAQKRSRPRPYFLRLAVLLLCDHQVLRDGDLEGIVDKRLQHHAAGAEFREHLVISHLGCCRKDQHSQVRMNGAQAENAGMDWAMPSHARSARLGRERPFNIVQKLLRRGEQAQVVGGRESPLQIVQDPGSTPNEDAGARAWGRLGLGERRSDSHTTCSIKIYAVCRRSYSFLLNQHETIAIWLCGTVKSGQ